MARDKGIEVELLHITLRQAADCWATEWTARDAEEDDHAAPHPAERQPHPNSSARPGIR